jgi:hypothetical protein
MKKYRGVVVFRYYQTLEIEAATPEDAEHAMCEAFDLSKADGESEVLDLEELQ